MTQYDGDTQLLTKRMTLGLGKFQIHKVRIGEVVFWENGAIQPPFDAGGGGLGDGGGQKGGLGTDITASNIAAAFEHLYEQPSTILPGDVISSGSVTGQQIPRANEFPSTTPYFNVAPNERLVDKIQLDFSFPQGIQVLGTNSGRPNPANGRIIFYAERLDANGTPLGGEFPLLDFDTGQIQTQRPLRFTRFVVPPNAPGNWRVRAVNVIASHQNLTNGATWDGLRGHKNEVRIRPKTTEVVMRVRAGKGMSQFDFANVWIEATRIVPVYENGAWTEQPTKKALWAFADLVRAEYSLNQPTGLDLPKLTSYVGVLPPYDEFNGQLQEVSSFWEAAGEVLNVIRADPIKIGNKHSFVRDESQARPRHVLTRRQTTKDSGTITYKFSEGEGGGDVIVEYARGADPTKPDTVRAYVGQQSRTPKTYRINGVSTAEHATMLARWLAAISVYRTAERTQEVEWDGRQVYPGDNILSDVWYLRGYAVAGIDGLNGNVLTLDEDITLSGNNLYASLRRRDGREWGPLRVTIDGPRTVTMNAADVLSLTTSTGLDPSDIIALSTQDPTAITIGPLVELQKQYVARGAVPNGPDRITIEMVRDDARVWQFLGEAIVVPQPPAPEPRDPVLPEIARLTALARRIETTIEVAWGLTPARGADTYEVALSYDAGGNANAGTWEPVSNDEDTRGTHPIRQSDAPVTMRARARSRLSGIHGPWTVTTFTTLAPQVDGGGIKPGSVDITAFVDALKGRLEPNGGIDQQITAAREAVEDLVEDVAEDLETARTNLSDETANLRTRADSLRLTLSADPIARAAASEPFARDVWRTLQETGRKLMDFEGRLLQVANRMTEAGIETDSPNGRARMIGFANVDKRINDVSISVDALRGEIKLLATTVVNGDFSGLVEAISQVEITLNSVESALTQRVTLAQRTTDQIVITDLGLRMGAAEGAISLRATKTELSDQATLISQARADISALQGVVLSSEVGRITQNLNLVGRSLQDMLGFVLANRETTFTEFGTATTRLHARIDGQGAVVAEQATDLRVFKGATAAGFSRVDQVIATGLQAEASSRTALAAVVNDPATGLVRTRADLVTLDRTISTPTTGIADRLVSLSSTVTNPQTGLGYTRALAESLDQVVTTPVSGIAARLTALSSQVNDVNTGLPKTRAELTTLNTTVTHPTTGLARTVSDMYATLYDPTAGLARSHARITEVSETITDPTTGLAKQISDVSSQVNDPVTGLPATESRLTTLNSTVNTPETGIAARLQDVRVTVYDPTTGLSATGSRVTTLTNVLNTPTTGVVARLDDVRTTVYHQTTGLAQTESRVTTLTNVLNTPTTGVVARLDEVRATVYHQTTGLAQTESRLTNLTNVVSSPTTGLVKVTSDLQTEVANARQGSPSLTSRLQTIAQAAIDGDAAIAGTLTQVSTRANGGTANGEVFIVAESAPSGFSAAYGIRLAANNTRAGLSILVRSNGTSVIALDATQLLIRDPNLGGGSPTTLVSISAGVAEFAMPFRVRGQDIEAFAVANATAEYSGGTAQDRELQVRAGTKVDVLGIFQGYGPMTSVPAGAKTLKVWDIDTGGLIAEQQIYQATIDAGTNGSLQWMYPPVVLSRVITIPTARLLRVRAELTGNINGGVTLKLLAIS